MAVAMAIKTRSFFKAKSPFEEHKSPFEEQKSPFEEHKSFCVKSFQFLSMQLGMSSTGEKDDAGRPMGSMIASTRGIEDLK